MYVTEALAEQTNLQVSYARAVPGLQLLQHCNTSSGGVLPPDHREFPGYHYAVYPFYPNKTDETDAGWAAAVLEVVSPDSRQTVLHAMIMGVPSINGPQVEVCGKDLPLDADRKVASVLGSFAEGTEQFLATHPSVAEGLRRVNKASLLGRQRRRALRALGGLVQQAMKS